MVDIHIKNFQSIQDLNLKIDGFTVIVGQSNIGKSAIRRAIDFALFANWSKSYVRNGEKDCFVSIKKDNISLSKTKGKSNITEINGIVYEKSGTGSPEEFKDFGIKKLETTDDEYNIMISSQLDRLFLSSFSDTEQHKVLNAVLETSTYEEALRMVNADINNLAKVDRELSASIDQKTEELESHKNILTILERIEKANDSMDTINDFIDFTHESSDLLNVQLALTSAIGKFVIVDINQFMNLTDAKTSLKTKSEKISSLYTKVDIAISALSMIAMKEKNTSLLHKNTIMNRLLNNIILTEYVESSTLMSATKIKVAKAEKIMALFNNILDKNSKNSYLVQFLRLNDNSYITKKMDVIDKTLTDINDLIILHQFVTRYDKNINLLESINFYNSQITEIAEEITKLKELLPKICETCGQELHTKDHQ